MPGEQSLQTQTVDSEIAPEPQLLSWSSNYALRADAAKHVDERGMADINDYEEAAIFQNPDGSHTLNIAVTPLSRPPETNGATENMVGDHAARTTETGYYLDAASLEQAFQAPVVKSALSNLGFNVERTKEDGASYFELALPSNEQFNRGASYLREQTGFAPTLISHTTGHFPAADIPKAGMIGSILAGSDFRDREHDLTAHVAHWLLFNQEAFKAIAHRGMQVEKDLAGAKHDPGERYHFSRQRDEHYGSIESIVSITNFWEAAKLLNPTLSPEEHEQHELHFGNDIADLMYGSHYDLNAKQQAAVEQAVADMPKRLEILAGMPADYQIAA